MRVVILRSTRLKSSSLNMSRFTLQELPGRADEHRCLQLHCTPSVHTYESDGQRILGGYQIRWQGSMHSLLGLHTAIKAELDYLVPNKRPMKRRRRHVRYKQHRWSNTDELISRPFLTCWCSVRSHVRRHQPLQIASYVSHTNEMTST